MYVGFSFVRVYIEFSCTYISLALKVKNKLLLWICRQYEGRKYFSIGQNYAGDIRQIKSSMCKLWPFRI